MPVGAVAFLMAEDTPNPYSGPVPPQADVPTTPCTLSTVNMTPRHACTAHSSPHHFVDPPLCGPQCGYSPQDHLGEAAAFGLPPTSVFVFARIFRLLVNRDTSIMLLVVVHCTMSETA